MNALTYSIDKNYIYYGYYSNYGCHGMTTNTAITTIQLELDVRKRLQSLGKKGETYNDIIKRLIKKAAYVDFIEEQYAILDNEKNWVSLDDL